METFDCNKVAADFRLGIHWIGTNRLKRGVHSGIVSKI